MAAIPGCLMGGFHGGCPRRCLSGQPLFAAVFQEADDRVQLVLAADRGRVVEVVLGPHVVRLGAALSFHDVSLGSIGLCQHPTGSAFPASSRSAFSRGSWPTLPLVGVKAGWGAPSFVRRSGQTVWPPPHFDPPQPATGCRTKKSSAYRTVWLYENENGGIAREGAYPLPVVQSHRTGRLRPGKGWGTQCSPPPARVWATRPNLRPTLQEPIPHIPSGRVLQAPDGPPRGHSRLRAFPPVGIPGLGGRL